jgi:hypothetical protein
MANRAKNLFQSRSIPGWILVVWSILGNISTAQDVAEWLAAMQRFLTSPIVYWLALVLGLAWLGVSVFRPNWLSVVFGDHSRKLSKRDARAAVFSGRTFYLTDFADEATHHVVSGRTFLDCTFIGPAIMAPLQDVRLAHCSFSVGMPEVGPLIVRKGQQPTDYLGSGVIGFTQCHFDRCKFRFIGILTTEELLEQFARNMSVATSVPLGAIFKAKNTETKQGGNG